MEHFEELIAMEEGSNDGNDCFDDRQNEVTEIVDVEENSSRLVRFEPTTLSNQPRGQSSRPEVGPVWTGPSCGPPADDIISVVKNMKKVDHYYKL